MSETKLGKITTTPKGEWSSTASYERLDIVQLKGTSWIAKRANTGVEPTEGDDWMLSAEGAPQIDDTTVSAETPWSSKNTVDRFCPEIMGEGNPVVLENCVEGYPLNVTASWEVQQEGSGTPHIEGYGTNKFQWAKADETLTNDYGLTLEYKAATEEIHIYGTNTYTSAATGQFIKYSFPTSFTNMVKAGKTITLSVTSSGSATGLYFSINYKDADNKEYGLIGWTGSSETTTVPDNFAKLAYFYFGSKPTLTTIDTTIKIQIEEGSTATEWTPYAANIRPFVGKENIGLQKRGKNLAWNNDSGKPIDRDLSVTGYNSFGSALPKGTYYIHTSKVEQGGSRAPYICFRTAQNADIAAGQVYDGAKFTLSEHSPYWVMYSNGYDHGGSAGVTSVIHDFMITASPDAGDYEQATPIYYYNLALPETIYAGSVGTDGKVEKKYGVTVIDGETVKFSNLSGFWNLPHHSSPDIRSVAWVLCSHFFEEVYSNTNYEFCFVMQSQGKSATTAFSTPEELNAYCQEQYAAGTPVTIVYELESTESLTTTPATLPALSGTNTITTDADTMTVSARKDRPRFTGDDVSESLGYVPAAQTDLEATQATVGEMIVNSSTTPWKTVQNIVQSGIAPQVFPVGTQFKVETQSYGTLLFDVVGHNHHKNPNDLNAPTMTLQSHYVIYGMAFDAEELLWVNTTDSELPAGTYHFTAYKSDYGQDTREDGTFQFTTTKAIPVNGGFRHTVIGTTHSPYAVASITNGTFVTYDADGNVLESNIACILGSEGTDLGTFSVTEANMNVLVGKANSTQRNGYGSNNYGESGIRQWLNASTTNWWAKQTAFDRPTNYNSKLGFLGDVDSEFAAVLGETDIVVSRNKLYEYDGTLGGSYTVRDKMFIPSKIELNFGSNNGINEGSTLEYYDSATATDHIKYTHSGHSSAYWWSRSPTATLGGSVQVINPSGNNTGTDARNGFGIAPCCVIY